MAVQQQHHARLSNAELDAIGRDAVTAGVAVFAVYHLALAGFMAAAPHAFFTQVGPFGVLNDHYIRDAATGYAAIGVGLAVAVRHPSWRVPVLTIVFAQFALHSINHLVDIEASHPAWNGYFDFFSLAAATLVLGWLLRAAVHQARHAPRDAPRRRPS